MNPTQGVQPSSRIWPQYGQSSRSTGSVNSEATSNNTFFMPSSPSRRQRLPSEGYKPTIIKTCGQRPACLVNASVTWTGSNTIYAFGGFDQYTDEGNTRLAAMIRRG